LHVFDACWLSPRWELLLLAIGAGGCTKCVLFDCMKDSWQCMMQDQRTAAPFYNRIAAHFEQAQSLEEAERFYIKAGLARQVSILSAFPSYLPA